MQSCLGEYSLTLLDKSSLQEDLHRLFDWAKEWQMKFNIEKCKVMHDNSNHNFKYYMDNNELETVQEEKDLGVLLTND